MTPRELILLSPYRIPAQNSLMLGNDDVGAFLNGYTALWHPAAAVGASGPPRIGSPYDYEQPTAGHIYAVPDSPPLFLPDDWDQRVKDAGAVAFRCTMDRETTLANLKEALSVVPHEEAQTTDNEQRTNLLNLERDRVAPFFGIGFGYVMIEALFEAMEHENLLATADLWQDVQQAIAALGDTDTQAYRRPLQSAADRLLSAREVLYPVTIHVLDLCLLEEQRLGEPLPAAFEKGLPLNLLTPVAVLEKLGREHPERLTALRERIPSDLVEVCTGCYLEREDALLPVESQVWNLVKGVKLARELLGQEPRTFARKRFAAHPQLPLLLHNVGLRRMLLLAFDDAVLPSHRTAVVSWPSPDGKQVEAFTRTPYGADNPQTFFHVTHYLHRTIMQDHAATFALLHSSNPAATWYHDWLELSRFGPVLGQWTTFSRYFNDVQIGEHLSASAADEFHGDYLSERINAHDEHPVSWFARHVRGRRRIDTAWTLAALHRGLTPGPGSASDLELQLATLEKQFESGSYAAEREAWNARLESIEKTAADTLAQRLLARAAADNPGYLVLNPCSFTRRVALELEGITRPLPIEGPIKACQPEGNLARLIVEVPAFGFAWFPAGGPPGTSVQTSRIRLADSRCVRNEFFEAEVDPATGGLKAIRDHRTRVNRLGQQLVYNPGSTMRAKEVKVTSTGPALGEIISEGAILDEQEQVLASFRQRFRAWLGRPLLELRIEIFPQHEATGYPWHSYYGARFAWRDERATLLRGVNGTSYITSHTRPETLDFLELRLGKQNTVLFPGGLPFHQRHGGRMVDVILMPEGEQAKTFELAVGLERDYPAQTALGMVTPVPIVATAKGPPHIGTTGWLFHLDAPNLMLTNLRPAGDGGDAVIARFLECGGHGGQAEFRCVRDPRRAVFLDALGASLLEVSTQGDAVVFEFSQSDLAQLRIEFS